MTWLWFCLLAQSAPDAYACATVVTPHGDVAGYVVAWTPAQEPPERSIKIDARAVDPSGRAGWISLVLAGPHQSLPFDDPTISGALRRVLALPPAATFSTLSIGDDRWAGSVTGCYERDARLDGDPFASVLSARILHVEAGFLGQTPALPGPVIQRYGGNNPWPSDRFEPEKT